MPGGLAIGREVSNGSSIVNLSGGGTGVAVTPGATNGVPGAYAPLLTATAADAAFLGIYIDVFSGGVANVAVDIAVGPLGQEVIILPKLMMSQSSAANTPEERAQFNLPISIKAGSRLSARAQSTNGTSSFVAVALYPYNGAFTEMAGSFCVDALGFTGSTTSGTALTPGSSTPGKGAYVPLIASTTRNYLGLFGLADAGASSLSYDSYAIDIATGPLGQEKIVMPDQFVAYGSDGGLDNLIPFVPVPIKAGTRISARCSGDDNGLPPIGLTLYGIWK